MRCKVKYCNDVKVIQSEFDAICSLSLYIYIALLGMLGMFTE